MSLPLTSETTPTAPMPTLPPPAPSEYEEEHALTTTNNDVDPTDSRFNDMHSLSFTLETLQEDAVALQTVDKDHAIGLSNYLYKLYQSKNLTDIQVLCKNEKDEETSGEEKETAESTTTTFDLHKPVLSYSSGYFGTLLEQEPTIATHTLDFSTSIAPETFDLVATSFYTGQLLPLLKTDNAISLLQATHLLQAERLHEQCTSFILSSMLTIDEALNIWIAANACENEVLLKRSTAMIGRHLQEICNSSTFLQLTKGQLEDLLGSDGLQVVNEMAVYNAAMNWIKYDLSTRQESVYDVMQLVRFPYLSKDFLTSTVAEEQLVLSDPKAMTLFSSALQYKLGSKRAIKSMSSGDGNDSLCRRRDSIAHSLRGGVEQFAKQQEEMAMERRLSMGSQAARSMTALDNTTETQLSLNDKWHHWLDVHVVFPWQYFQTNIWHKYVASPVIQWTHFCKDDVVAKHIAGPLSRTSNLLVLPNSRSTNTNKGGGGNESTTDGSNKDDSTPTIQRDNVIEKYILRPIAESPCIPDSSDDEYEEEEVMEPETMASLEHDSSMEDLLHESVWTKISDAVEPKTPPPLYSAEEQEQGTETKSVAGAGIDEQTPSLPSPTATATAVAVE